MGKELLQLVKVVRVSAASAAGTTAITGSTVDTQGFDGVMFVTAAQTITSTGVQSIKIQHGDASDLSDAADVSGTSVTIADSDDDKAVVTDLSDLSKRYVRAVISRATANSAFGEVFAFLYRAQQKPVVQSGIVSL